MADIKKVVLYGAIGVAIVLVVAGVSVRSWLKSQIDAAGSPSAFAAQAALTGLDRKVRSEFATVLTPDQAERLQTVIQKAQGLSRQFSQPQTIRLFEILGSFDHRTKSEGGRPSKESILSLISDLESLSADVAQNRTR